MSVLLLGAGFGNRLRPLTDDRPKCAVEIAGEPLAARILRQFAERGVRRATVVIGHMADRARALIGPRIGDLEVTFVENAEFATTNTMYSTLVGMDALADGGFLVEGDIVASEAAIDRLVAADRARSHWAADPWTAQHSGSRLRDDGTGRIVGQEIWRAATEGGCANLWKSAGMLRLDARGAARLRDALEREAAAGHRNIYYDDVVGKHVGAMELDILDLTGAPWVEIDDHDDMAQAQRLFGGTR
ncbi:MAG: phosphocholine cytidylyltransferase family protein [Deltaproteobacteria bacterium]|nr:phosphocholine cytidylyltransferase family protein [Deltaproteobacteria bacterium]